MGWSALRARRPVRVRCRPIRGRAVDNRPARPRRHYSGSDTWADTRTAPRKDHDQQGAHDVRPVGSKYLLEQPLGRGATGTVWRARQRETAGAEAAVPGQPGETVAI